MIIVLCVLKTEETKKFTDKDASEELRQQTNHIFLVELNIIAVYNTNTFAMQQI